MRRRPRCATPRRPRPRSTTARGSRTSARSSSAIAARYLFARPLPWADELNVILLLWLTFWTGAFVTRDREQVVFDLAYERCGPRAKRAMAFAGSAALGLFFLWALPTLWDYVAF